MFNGPFLVFFGKFKLFFCFLAIDKVSNHEDLLSQVLSSWLKIELGYQMFEKNLSQIPDKI